MKKLDLKYHKIAAIAGRKRIDSFFREADKLIGCAGRKPHIHTPAKIYDEIQTEMTGSGFDASVMCYRDCQLVRFAG